MEKKLLQSAIEFKDTQFTKRILFHKGDSATFLLNFQPGQTLPPHRHPGSDIYIIVLKGGGTFTVEGEEMSISAEDALHFDGSEKLSFTNNEHEPTTLYVVLTKMPNEKFAREV